MASSLVGSGEGSPPSIPHLCFEMRIWHTLFSPGEASEGLAPGREGCVEAQCLGRGWEAAAQVWLHLDRSVTVRKQGLPWRVQAIRGAFLW